MGTPPLPGGAGLPGGTPGLVEGFEEALSMKAVTGHTVRAQDAVAIAGVGLRHCWGQRW